MDQQRKEKIRFRNLEERIDEKVKKKRGKKMGNETKSRERQPSCLKPTTAGEKGTGTPTPDLYKGPPASPARSQPITTATPLALIHAPVTRGRVLVVYSMQAICKAQQVLGIECAS